MPYRGETLGEGFGGGAGGVYIPGYERLQVQQASIGLTKVFGNTRFLGTKDTALLLEVTEIWIPDLPSRQRLQFEAPGTDTHGGPGVADTGNALRINPIRNTNNPIEKAVRGVGVEWVKTVTNTYSLDQMRQALRDALTTKQQGPKVIVAQSECMLNRQRRVKPLIRQRIQKGERVVRERFGIEQATAGGGMGNTSI